MLTRIYIDEAGRWPLAGPLFVGAIMQIWNIEKKILQQFKDSKTLTENQRENLFKQIQKLEKENKLIYSIWAASEKEIDEFWITKSINLAISRAIFELLKNFYNKILKNDLEQSNFGKDLVKKLEIEKILNKNEIYYQDIINLKNIIFSTNEDYEAVKNQKEKLTEYKLQTVLIDWNSDFNISKDLEIKAQTIVSWDAKIPQISMASIVAKVSRDNYMKQLSKKYPNYLLEEHKWYWNIKHIELIKKHWISPIHRKRFLINLSKELTKKQQLTEIEKSITNEIENYKNDLLKNSFFSIRNKNNKQLPTKQFNWPVVKQNIENNKLSKTWLLIHICCAPDLAWPLRWLKNYFKLYLFWYNPNIHPYSEHKKRYDQYIKLLKLEEWDYEILPDWYDKNEFFNYLIKEYKKQNPNKSEKEILQELSKMEEKNSDRCWWCYDLRLLEAAKTAEKFNIPYFTTTLLISPKKDLTHLWLSWIKAQEKIGNKSKYLFFDFKKWWWFEKAAQIVRNYNLRRQNYCWCIWTIPIK